jgi:ribokinase
MAFEPKVIVAYTHNVSEPAIRVHRLPRPGETVRAIGSNGGLDGGKGTDVAVAIARLHVPVALVAHVKGGAWYPRAKEILAQEGIDDTYIVCDADEKKTGGCVIIDDEGRNMIVLASGNQQVLASPEIDRALTALRVAQYCVTGYELDRGSVHEILRKSAELGIRTVLNPSPVPDQMPEDWNLVSLLVLNEVELCHMLTLAGVPFQNQFICLRRLRGSWCRPACC